jgi:hypothetical protein
MELCDGGSVNTLYEGFFHLFFFKRRKPFQIKNSRILIFIFLKNKITVLEKPLTEPIIALVLRETLKVRIFNIFFSFLLFF